MSNDVNDTTSLSRLFHLNSEPWLNEQAKQSAPFAQKSKSYPNADRVALPPTTAGPVNELAMSRRSVRAFQDSPLPLTELAAVLRAGYMALSPDPHAKDQKILRRSTPSAGGLYPLELYVLVRNVEGLPKGVYHYDAIGDELELLTTDDWEPAANNAFLTWQFVEYAPFVICLGAVFERTQTKYGPRGYRYALLEAGHTAQNLCLTAEEMNLSSLCLGGYYDSILNGIFSFSGEDEAIIYAVAFGRSATK
ncbi:MAG: SagB/ThcOx family dehydrogenase [Pikeienuella sp.]